MKIKWMWNGIKADGKLYRATYSKGILIGDTQESITIYAKDYRNGLPNFGPDIENHSDLQSDYFETDTMRIRQDSKFWKEAHVAWLQAEVHHRKCYEKRAKKYGFTINAPLPEVAAILQVEVK